MGTKAIAKNFIRTHPMLERYASATFSRWLGRNTTRLRGRDNALRGYPLLRGCAISIQGSDNIVVFGSATRLSDCRIFISGSNNRILIGSRCRLHHTEFWIEDDGNCIDLGDDTTIEGSAHLAATEGKSIRIGKDCMFSSEIVVRTGDSHSIIDALSGRRTNPAADVSIGDHIWLGSRVIVLKGAGIPDNSIVGTGSIVIHKYETCNIILAGNPARLVRENVDWLRQRI